jgi:DNA polymerase-4
MPTARALKVCPDLILVPHTPGLYGAVSRRMFDLCETLTPVIQRNSIDEGYLDLSPCGLRGMEEIEASVRRLQGRIWGELQISVSMGIARNKLVAQIASKLRKPRAFVVVPPGTEAAFLAPLPLGVLPGIGAKTEAALRESGFRLVGDLLAGAEDKLRAAFGNGWKEVQAAARGEDERPVETERDDARSYSQQETFGSDLGDFAAVERVAKRMLDELMTKVRRDEKRVRTLTIKVRYPDFTHASHGRTLETATDLVEPLYPLVGPLLRASWTKRRPLRLVSVKLSGVEDRPAQLEMFSQTEEKRRRLADVLDDLNRRRPGAAVRRGHQLE